MTDPQWTAVFEFETVLLCGLAPAFLSVRTRLDRGPAACSFVVATVAHLFLSSKSAPCLAEPMLLMPSCWSSPTVSFLKPPVPSRNTFDLPAEAAD